MSLHNKYFGGGSNDEPSGKSNKPQATLEKEIAQDIDVMNVNEFTDLRRLLTDVETGEDGIDPISLLSGKEGDRIRSVPFSDVVDGVLYDVHGSYYDFEKDEESTKHALLTMIRAYQDAMDEHAVYEKGVKVELFDRNSTERRLSKQIEYNRLEWITAGAMAATAGGGWMLHFHDKTSRNDDGSINYTPTEVPGHDHAPFSFALNHRLGNITTAMNDPVTYTMRCKGLMHLVVELADIMAKVSHAAMVIKAVLHVYHNTENRHEFLNVCVENGLVELMEGAKETLNRVFGCLNTTMVEQWAASYHTPKDYFLEGDEAKIRYNHRLERNINMFRSILLTAMVVGSGNNKETNLLSKAAKYAHFERWVYANLHKREPTQVQLETASIMQRTIKNYWYGNSQYTKFITDALGALGITPNTPTIYGDVDPLSFDFGNIFHGASEEEIHEYYTDVDTYMLGGNADSFREEHVNIDFHREEIKKEQEQMNKTADMVLSEDRTENGYTREIAGLSAIMKAPVYANVINDHTAELAIGLSTVTYLEEGGYNKFIRGGRMLGCLDDAKETVLLSVLNDEAVEWLRRSQLVPVKQAKMSGMEVYQVNGTLSDEYYSRDLNDDVMNNPVWRDIINTNLVPNVGGWRFNHHRSTNTIPELEGDWGIREQSATLSKEQGLNLTPKSMADHLISAQRRKFLNNVSLFSDAAEADEICHMHSRPWGGFSAVGKLNHLFGTAEICKLGSDLNKDKAIRKVTIAGREYIAILSNHAATEEFLAKQGHRLANSDYDEKPSDNHWYVFGYIYGNERLQNPEVVLVDLYTKAKVEIPGLGAVDVTTVTDLPDEVINLRAPDIITTDDIYEAFEKLDDQLIHIDADATKLGLVKRYAAFTNADVPNQDDAFNEEFISTLNELDVQGQSASFTNIGNDTYYNFVMGGLAKALGEGDTETLTKLHPEVSILPKGHNTQLLNWFRDELLNVVTIVSNVHGVLDMLNLEHDTFYGSIAALGDTLTENLTVTEMCEINNTISSRFASIVSSFYEVDAEDLESNLFRINGAEDYDKDNLRICYNEELAIVASGKFNFNEDNPNITLNEAVTADIENLLEGASVDTVHIYVHDKDSDCHYSAVSTLRHGLIYGMF